MANPDTKAILRFPAAPESWSSSERAAYDEITEALRGNKTASKADLPAIKLAARHLARANDLLDRNLQSDRDVTKANAASKVALEFLRALGLTPRARASVERLATARPSHIDEFED